MKGTLAGELTKEVVPVLGGRTQAADGRIKIVHALGHGTKNILPGKEIPPRLLSKGLPLVSTDGSSFVSAYAQNGGLPDSEGKGPRLFHDSAVIQLVDGTVEGALKAGMVAYD